MLDSQIPMCLVLREGSFARGFFRFSRFCVAAGLLLAAAMFFAGWTETAHAQTAATYTVTFEGNWNVQSTPGGVVGGAHFTAFACAVHNGDVTFWEPGGRATPGVELVAELGGTSTFLSEVRAAGAAAKRGFSVSPGFLTVGNKRFQVEFTRTHPQFTLLSMLGPSPDWFVGVSGLSLLDGQDNWRSSHTVDLFAYDAGTEEGENFSLSNPDTNPPGTITSLKGKGKFSDVPIARLSFSLKKTDRNSLSAVYRASGGDSWTRKDNWNSDEPVSEWYGVTTDQDGRVTELRLGDNNLSGTVNEDIVELKKLEVLYLDDNPDLRGELPRSLMDLAALSELDISSSGVCPPDDEGFRAWLMNLASFTGNDSCGSVEADNPETGEPGGGGGGCAVASGGGFEKSVYHLVPAVFAVMMVLLGAGGLNDRRSLRSDR